ncbi:hypothetical protein [Rhizobium sp. S163]|uniref:hypothetical protein n=1 Tax=Rhizobium sp. S163 TaxID=3055039 RepID=UPI0025A9F950|nr:hypothetical protein [Rhizobium sp. S163]MDM9646560.1 hypothetical protein [Rhizobium sp. S163]
MSQMHLIDHLDTARKLAEINQRPLLVYLIELAKEEAFRPKPAPEGSRCPHERP